VVEPVGRIFLAVDLTPAARQILSRRVMVMTDGAKLPGRVSPPRNWHMTLWFLGQVPRDRFEVMVHLLTETSLGEAFPCRFERLGAFPRPGRASVLWVGVSTGADKLSALAARVGEAVEGAGLRVPERPFSAHLTLSRLRPPQDLRPLVAGAPPAGVDMVVKDVTVFRSHLGGGPPSYEVMERIPLD
jgi:2'-5' RNA ligase